VGGPIGARSWRKRGAIERDAARPGCYTEPTIPQPFTPRHALEEAHMAANPSTLLAEPSEIASAPPPARPHASPAPDAELFARRRRFSVDDYHRMAALGLIGPGERTELLDGEVVHKMPISSAHAGCVKRFNALLIRLVADRAIVGVQDPVRLDDRSEPEPDLSILRPRADAYGSAHPVPADILWLVEVADRSRQLDRAVKVPLYAAAGVPEVWLVDLAAGAVEVYRDPDAAGFRLMHRHGRGDVLRPAALEGVAIAVDDVLGSPAEVPSSEPAPAEGAGSRTAGAPSAEDAGARD